MSLKKLLTLLLLVTLMLSPVAVMEEIDEALEGTDESTMIEIEEEQEAEPTVEEEATEFEGEQDNPDEDELEEDEDEEDSLAIDEEITIDLVDELVEEQGYLELSNLPMYAAQSDVDEFELENAGIEDITDETFLIMFEGKSEIDINTSFPDEAFREYVRSNFDIDKNGSLSVTEREAVIEIFCAKAPGYHSNDKGDIKDLTGVKLFPNLKRLECWNNQLTTLDVSGLSNLSYIDCCMNYLATLNLKGCSSLTYLECSSNKLATLDVTSFTNLDYLGCFDNQLTSLDVTHNILLQDLWCSDNQLTSLDVSKNTLLKHLQCEGNKLKTIDVSHCSRYMLDHINDRYKNYNKGLNYVYYLNDEDNGIEEVFISHDVDVILIVTESISSPGTGIDTISETSTTSDSTPTSSEIGPSNSTGSISATVSEEAAIPTIAAIKKNGKTTIYAAPWSVYQLDLGGATGKSFKSSKKKVATVDANGLVTVKKAGKTKITFKVGKKKRTVTLTVKDPTIPTAIALNLTGTVAAKVGVPQVLTVTALPEGTYSVYKWKSSNKKVATVSNGVVTFKKKGKVTITATATRGKKKAKVKFVVSK